MNIERQQETIENLKIRLFEKDEEIKNLKDFLHESNEATKCGRILYDRYVEFNDKLRADLTKSKQHNLQLQTELTKLQKGCHG